MAPTPTACDDSPGREQDRDDRDQRLGQRRPDRGQHRSDRAFGQSELAPEPFDAVGEQLCAEQDDEQRDDQDDDVHRLNGNSEGASDADGDDCEDPERDRRPSASPLAGVGDGRDDHPADGRRDDRQQTRATGTPPGRAARSWLPSVARSSRGPPLSGEIPSAIISTTPIDQQADRDVGHRDEQPADAALGGHGPVVGGASWIAAARRRSRDDPEQQLDGRVDQHDHEQQPQVAEYRCGGRAANRPSRRGRRRSRSGRRRTGRCRRG